MTTNRTRVRYSTNTERGSLGLRAFDQNWNLVALHHGGDPNFAAGHKPEFNEGIPMDAIVTLLNNRGLSIKSDLLKRIEDVPGETVVELHRRREDEIIERLFKSSEALDKYLLLDEEGLYDLESKFDSWVGQVELALKDEQREKWQRANENRIFHPGNSTVAIESSNFENDLDILRAILMSFLSRP